jgi:ADP-ribose pyrophosphatase YjhB (NUDIX family)
MTGGSTPPEGPTAAVIAVLVHQGHVLLVRRGREPNAGCWGFPGGKIRWGESHGTAACRELREETAIAGEALRVFAAVDVMTTGVADNATDEYHYLLIAVEMRYSAGQAAAATDSAEARWFAVGELPEDCLPDVARLVALAQYDEP